MNVARTKFAAFQIAELVEHEQRMIAGAGKVLIVGGTFLIGLTLESMSSTMALADAGRAPGQSIALTDQPVRRGSGRRQGTRCRCSCNGVAADNPSHRRVTSQAVGVVHVLVATQATEDGLAKQSCHLVLAALAGARIDELVANHVRQSERVIELTVGKGRTTVFGRVHDTRSSRSEVPLPGRWIRSDRNSLRGIAITRH
ncbi:hypothetical protein MES5069_440004 [Mesorhizobium escarrei]|uniref:Uncharacterized protein n=1 Tax=Mesorhizobium escarrei TaxID=666018 RepID=A0ABN8K585_9HYPH|nr:hypothetical protein MES5069_440004 [Mesorhizobium escarrei]